MKFIKLQHVLYALGIFFVALYVYGLIDFSLYSHNRWGYNPTSYSEQIPFLYIIFSPIILAYHISKKPRNTETPNGASKYFSFFCRIIRGAYLATIGILLFIASIVTTIATNYEFSINKNPSYLEAFPLGFLAVLFFILGIATLKLTYKFK
jgi:hypothetical protein